MKILKLSGMAVIMLAAAAPAFAQTAAPVNSFFERCPEKECAVKTVYVGGEVQNPGPVDLSALPLRNVALKEVVFNKDKPEFKGAYFFSGYALYDILNTKPVKKVNADFSPTADLYVVVENDKGDKAVFSWGEIFYAKDSFKTLITRTARAINPDKSNAQWPLPETSRLVCAGDLYNTRFITNPTKITVRSVADVVPAEKYPAAIVPELEISAGGKTTVFTDPAKIAAKRSFTEAAYVHSLGFQGMQSVEGFVLKDLLAAAGVGPQDSGAKLALVFAENKYLGAFSLSEIVNRSDSADFLLVDKGPGAYDRFALSAAGDFFLDRNVRAVDKIDIIII